jgi:DNA-binding LytR/AlgR family response regulator
LHRDGAPAQVPREFFGSDDVSFNYVDEVCFFQSDTKYTRGVTGGSECVIRKTLKELSNELDPAQFWQIHRSTIVNVNAIAGVSRELSGGFVAKLKNRKEILPVSPQFAHRFRQM